MKNLLLICDRKSQELWGSWVWLVVEVDVARRLVGFEVVDVLYVASSGDKEM